MSAVSLPVLVSWFDGASPDGKPALGDPELITWGNFIQVCAYRREGPKDGPSFVGARFELEPNGRQVRRKKANVIARTLIILDIEPNKKTGEIPPDPAAALARIKQRGLAGFIYTSHSHKAPKNTRFRVVLPLSSEIPTEIPAPQILAALLGLDGVLDMGKTGASSLFYLPSCEDNPLAGHYTEATDGEAVDAAWIIGEGNKILAAERAEKERLASEAQAVAAEKRAAKIAAGFDADDSLIDKIRVHLDLQSILAAHGYDKSRDNYRHPNSSSGIHGANIKVLGGIERIYSHNSTDPLHASNLPEWCGSVTALDAFDVTAILDFSGDRKKALRGLAERFGLSKDAERKQLASALFRLVKRNAPQKEIEVQALTHGRALGLSRDDVYRVAEWVAQQIAGESRAA